MSIKLEEQDLSKLSPMMQHYLQTKKEYPGCILFYRLGDFYEMFFEDAEIASRELELTLTGKSCGLPERAPMCGVPFHAVDSYLTRLVEKGYKAARRERTISSSAFCTADRGKAAFPSPMSPRVNST